MSVHVNTKSAPVTNILLGFTLINLIMVMGMLFSSTLYKASTREEKGGGGFPNFLKNPHQM